MIALQQLSSVSGATWRSHSRPEVSWSVQPMALLDEFINLLSLPFIPFALQPDIAVIWSLAVRITCTYGVKYPFSWVGVRKALASAILLKTF